MKFPKLVSSPWMGLFTAGCFVFLAVTGCTRKADSTAPSPKLSAEDAKQQRLAWNLKTTVEAYDKVGDGNSVWDEPARRALTEFARVRAQSTESDEPWGQIIATNCNAAIAAGCRDGMISYLHARCSLDSQISSKEVADEYCKAAIALKESSYPAVRKFYASRRAVQQVYSAYGTNADQGTIHEVGGGLMDLVMETINDKTMPPAEVYDVCDEGLAAYKGNKDLYERLYRDIEKKLFENWPDESVTWLLKGEGYVELAWKARGTGYANKVTEEGWKLYRERLAVAEEALNRAWDLNPKDINIPLEFLTLELGQGQGRDRMELWFQRAMAIDPKCYDACYKKLFYLEPKWYGSAEEMLAFGRECVESKDWAGHVPLILLDAHLALRRYLDKSVQDDYWKQPGVWPDIKAAFDRFLELNPEAIGWRHNYTLYAYHCEQWEVLNELIPKLEPINYEFFGGKDEFDKMVRLAKEHTSKSKTAEQN